MSTEKKCQLLGQLDLEALGTIWMKVQMEEGWIVKIDLSLSRPSGQTENGDLDLVKEFKKLLSGMGLEKFPLPYKLEGTPFQKRIYHLAAQIPAGVTVSYGELAKLAGCRAPRAVGQALKKNPLPIIIPCHRIIGKDGSLTGFASGIAIKKMLLEYERMKKNESSHNE